MLDPETAQLWGPGGKMFEPAKKLSDYVGKNEKSKARGTSGVFGMPGEVFRGQGRMNE